MLKLKMAAIFGPFWVLSTSFQEWCHTINSFRYSYLSARGEKFQPGEGCARVVGNDSHTGE